MHIMKGQKKLKDEYHDPNVLPKINKYLMAGLMVVIKEYLTSFYCGVREPLEYIIRKTITVQTYGHYSTFATPDNEMIARMLHLPDVTELTANIIAELMYAQQNVNRNEYSILNNKAIP